MRPSVLLETIQTASAILEVRECLHLTHDFSIPAVSALTHDIAGIANASLDHLRGTTVRTKQHHLLIADASSASNSRAAAISASL